MEQRAAAVCRGGIKREAAERTQVAAFPESGRLPGLRQTVYSRSLRLNIEPLGGRRRQDPKEPWMDKQRFVLFSPVLVMVVGTFTIRLAERFLGVWAWVPWVVVYWALICVVVFWGIGKAAVARWMRPTQGKWLWSATAFVLVLPTIPMFLSS